MRQRLVVLNLLWVFTFVSHSSAFCGEPRTAVSETEKSILRRAIAAEPRNPENYRKLASVYDQEGNSEYAISTLKRGMDACSAAVGLRVPLAEALLRTGRWEEAMPYLAAPGTLALDSGPSDFHLRRIETDELLARVEALPTKGIPLPLAANMLVQLLVYRGQTREAFSRLDEMRLELPAEPSLTVLAADLHIEAGDLPKATELLREAVRLEPKPLWMASLADCLRQSGDRTESQNMATKAVFADQTCWQGYLVLARIHRDNDDYEAADENYRRALLLRPEDSGLANEAESTYLVLNPSRPPYADKILYREKNGWLKSRRDTVKYPVVAKDTRERIRLRRRMLATDVLEVTRIYEWRRETISRDGVTEENKLLPESQREVWNLADADSPTDEYRLLRSERADTAITKKRRGQKWREEGRLRFPWRPRPLPVNKVCTITDKNEDGISVAYSGSYESDSTSTGGTGKTRLETNGSNFYDRRGRLQGFASDVEYLETDASGALLWELRESESLRFE